MSEGREKGNRGSERGWVRLGSPGKNEGPGEWELKPGAMFFSLLLEASLPEIPKTARS